MDEDVELAVDEQHKATELCSFSYKVSEIVYCNNRATQSSREDTQPLIEHGGFERGSGRVEVKCGTNLEQSPRQLR